MSDDLVKRLRGWPISTAANVMRDAADRIEELEAELLAMRQSMEHFKYSAHKQKKRCHDLRHRRRALTAALQDIMDSTSIEAAKLVASIAIGGWGDEELVSKSRTTLAELTGGKDE